MPTPSLSLLMIAAMAAMAKLAGATSAASADTASPPSAVEPPESCPVTRPPVRPFAPPLPYPALPPSADHFWFGTEALWVMPKTDGTWRGLRTKDGYLDKLFVWRVGFDGRVEQKPKLTVKGRRLDAGAAPFTISHATNAYHPSFEWAMLAGVDIPTPGCWELNLHYGDSRLAFVVWVPE